MNKTFQYKGGIFSPLLYIRAVRHVSFSVAPGQTLGIVGESGCGKSTLGKLIVGMLQPDSGSIFFNGRNITKLKGRERFPYRRKIQMVFQDPYASLNPRFTVGDIVGEPLKIHYRYSTAERTDLVRQIIAQVDLKPEDMNRYPHEFSGGQRQRIAIARALVLNPDFIVCDEPTSALDVSIQAQIINLLKKIQADRGVSYAFITHDLNVIRHMSDFIAVMYVGNLVEYGPSKEIYAAPRHPYTQALLSAIPIPDPRLSAEKKATLLKGELPNILDASDACPFFRRCARSLPECRDAVPPLVAMEQRKVACFRAAEP